MNRQKNHFSSHHDPKLSHSEYTIGSDSFSTRDTFRCGDGNTRCETVGDLHGSCVNWVNRVSITDHSQSFCSRTQTFTHTLWHRGSVDREYRLILLGSWMLIQTGVWCNMMTRRVSVGCHGRDLFFYFHDFLKEEERRWREEERRWSIHHRGQTLWKTHSRVLITLPCEYKCNMRCVILRSWPLRLNCHSCLHTRTRRKGFGLPFRTIFAGGITYPFVFSLQGYIPLFYTEI